MRDEHVYFSDAGVEITSSRATFGTKFYPLRGITSVETVIVLPYRLPPLLIVFAGALWVCVAALTRASILGWLSSIITITAGVGWLLVQHPRHVVQIGTAAGDRRAFSHTNTELVEQIAQALSHAIKARG